MAADLEARITGAQAAHLIGVSRQLIRDWHKRGLLDRDEHGRYRYGDVLAAERRTRNCRRPGTFKRKPTIRTA